MLFRSAQSLGSVYTPMENLQGGRERGREEKEKKRGWSERGRDVCGKGVERKREMMRSKNAKIHHMHCGSMQSKIHEREIVGARETDP